MLPGVGVSDGVAVCVTVGVEVGDIVPVGEDKAVEVGVKVCDAVGVCVAVDVNVAVARG